MGTFSGTLNAAQAYIVNDIYLKYVNKDASNKKIIRMNYLVGVLVVALGVILGFLCQGCKQHSSMDRIRTVWRVYRGSNVLKWYWWRFNANGFYIGMLTGVAGALVFSRLFTGIEFLYYFPGALPALRSRQPDRHVYRTANRGRDPEKILPDRSPLGLLETGTRYGGEG
jgi:SSS family solute:Na+ symporter